LRRKRTPTQQPSNLYLVWTNFIDSTMENGGTEIALEAMPRAASEWLAVSGDAQGEHDYFVRWFRFQGLAVDP
jgi:hypothetical protein